jgi:FMN phosphatase YigB (HAD superfamily)
MQKTAIFDWDDTCAPNQRYYSRAKLRFSEWALRERGGATPAETAQLRFMNWVIERIGYRAPDEHAIITMIYQKGCRDLSAAFRETYAEVCSARNIVPQTADSDTVSELGKGLTLDAPDARPYTLAALIELETDLGVQEVRNAPLHEKWAMERFPCALQRTYQKMCEDLGLRIEHANLEQAYQFGMLAFDEEQWRKDGLIEGVPETLDFLASQGVELVLMSKGDPRVQWRKVEIFNAKKWFGERIHVVLDKNAEIVAEVIGSREKGHTCKVGNSIPSDIEPALKAGIGAVYIPCETWKYERTHNGVPVHPRLRKFDSIIQIKENFAALPFTGA